MPDNKIFAMLKDAFYAIAGEYTENEKFIAALWNEIEAAHTEEHRYYHNLSHLENLYKKLEAVRGNIEDWESIVFAIAYHDFVYNTNSGDNEEQSAEIAVDRLHGINYPADKALRCKAHILATKSHKTAANNDTNLFTDADLSILGADWETYKAYALNIAKEYSQMPMFKLGRRGVMMTFLKMPRLFKTELFYNKYEARARNNIQQEIDEILSA